MTYRVKDDEVVILIKPILDDDGLWDWELKTGIFIGKELATVNEAAGRAALDAAVSMAAVLGFIKDYPDFVDELTEYKEDILQDMFPEQYAAAVRDTDDSYTTDDNVIRLNRWTKTEGNA